MASALREQRRMARPQLRDVLGVLRRGSREAAARPHAAAHDDSVQADAAPAMLGQCHPEVPVLVAVDELPAADGKHGVPSVQRREGKGIAVDQLPWVQRGDDALDEVDRAEVAGVAPGRHGLRVALERPAQECQRAGRHLVVGVQRQHVAGACGT
jgi:hypothetical protein